MKQLFNITLSFLISLSTLAQTEAEDLHKKAKVLMNQGEYEDATTVFNQLATQFPTYTTAKKDVVFLNYLKRDFAKAIDEGKILVATNDADEQSFQILGLSYKAIAQYKEANQLYKAALKKYPNSGMLYCELAEVYALENKLNEAINFWEKGIEVDPNYSSNYYNACQYYATTNKHFWAAIYGELFLNIESFSVRGAAIKSIVLDSYKKLALVQTKPTSSANFEKLCVEGFQKASLEQINADYLTAYRTRFILDWFYNKNNEVYPFRLFDQQRYLIKEGLFEAYNQWLFGVAQSPTDYKTWSDQNPTLAKNFTEYQKGRVFKLITGQYYKNN
jgi:tetratricopeptide (TPR) repeat protein